ncbi:MAG: 50S ribosome-binding GTPase [Planctomycetota bacterium]|nr:50S ribosome-binding GTPase [Planctomycetota bacterium]
MQAAILSLRDSITGLVDTLQFEPGINLKSWNQAIERRLLPRLSPEFPLMAAICGGGSAGKSSLFNSLSKNAHSPVGAKAGLNRRVLVGGHPALLRKRDLIHEIFQPFGTLPEEITNAGQLTTPGDPLYASCEGLPEGLVLLDTPDFDTGAGGEYANRELARPVLEACDVLIYLFTNATYNNLANTEFIRRVLTDIGQRPCVLIYRAYESFPDELILDHSATVARNLYGADSNEQILGIYRAHDSNEVAAGNQPMQPMPLNDVLPLLDLLSSLDVREMRKEQTTLILSDVLQQAASAAKAAGLSRKQLQLYHDSLRIVQSHCVYRGLVSLPVQDVGNRLHRLWEESSPAGIKFLRNTSKVLGFPVKAGLKALHWMTKQQTPNQGVSKSLDARIEELEEAAGELHRQLIIDQLASRTTDNDPGGSRVRALIEEIRKAEGITGDEAPSITSGNRGAFDFTVDIHPSLLEARRNYQSREWRSRLEGLHKKAKAIIDIPVASSDHDVSFDKDLVTVLNEFRENMGFTQRIRETVFASLHLAPPVLAIVYVVHTGDVVGGSAVAGAKVGVAATVSAKVSGLFGLNDLWALIALPANTGLSEADQAQLKGMLEPVVQRWFQHRSAMIGELLQEQITGEVLHEAERRLVDSARLIENADMAIKELNSG